MSRLSRRRFLGVGSAAAAGLLVSGCDALTDLGSARGVLDFGQLMSLYGQRLLLTGQPLAREFTAADISPDFPLNGTSMPGSFDYFRMMASQFASFRLTVDGLVRQPLSLSLEEIKALPARTVHFVVANLLVLFVLVHVFEVVLAGLFNGMRSMITGRYVIKPQVGS